MMELKRKPPAATGGEVVLRMNYKNNNTGSVENQQKSYVSYILEVLQNSVSVFNGIGPNPVGTTTISDFLKSVKTGKYKKQVSWVRAAKSDKEEYKRRKNTLPAVTFGCVLKYRGLQINPDKPIAGPHNLVDTTGIITPDIDHHPDPESLKEQMKADPNILFAFLSPGGEGIKAGLFTLSIKNDEDHKRYFAAVERYFLTAYDWQIDKACKDIDRLTFASHDPDLFINENACLFDVDEWSPPEEESSRRSQQEDCHDYQSGSGEKKYALKVLESCCEEIRSSSPGVQHYTRLRKARLIGGYAHYINNDEMILTQLEKAVADSGAKKLRASMKTIKDGFEFGKREPIFLENKKSSQNKPRTAPPTDDEWEEPISLGVARPTPMPENLLPGPVGEMVKAVSLFTETPYELAAGLSLVAVASCVAGKYEVEVKRGYREPLNIMIAAALETGNRKSANVEALFAPHISWERLQLEEMALDIQLVASKNKAIDARITRLNNIYARSKDRFERDNLLKEIQETTNEKEPEPVPPRIIFDDITPEHMGTMAALHNGRMALVSDEGGIFDILAGRYSKNGAPNLDLFLKGYSGSAVRVDRGTRSPVVIDKPAISLGISPQPETLIRLGAMPGFRARGVLGRIGYLLPASLLGYRGLCGPEIPARVLTNYEIFIKNLLETASDEGPQMIRLSTRAYQEWKEFSLHIEKGMQPGGEYEFIKDWCGKLPGFAVRIAGLIHIMGGVSPEIPLGTMANALELAGVFLNHALFVFDMIGADESVGVARKIMSWAEREVRPEFSKSECFNSLRGSYPTMDKMEPGFKMLEERNHIIVVKKGTGGRPSYICYVNPAVVKGWF